MIDYVLYDPATGKIEQTGNVPPNMLDIQGTDTLKVLQGVGSLNRHYVKDGVITLRPDNPLKLSGTKITELPKPSTIFINGVSYACNDTDVDLVFPYPGNYAIRIEAFPYKDMAFNLEQK